jgi:hypothetical protein
LGKRKAGEGCVYISSLAHVDLEVPGSLVRGAAVLAVKKALTAILLLRIN